jgi:hypothetical protein
MGASFWRSKVGLCYLSGSYKNFVKWGFLSFFLGLGMGFSFSFSFSFLFLPEERNATKTDRLTDRPTNQRTYHHLQTLWIDGWIGWMGWID